MNEQPQVDAGYKTPPPIPPQPDATGLPPKAYWQSQKAALEEEQRISSAFGEHYAPLERPLSALRVVDALLKQPARIAYELTEGQAAKTAAVLAAIAAICTSGYGFIMGSFAGGLQFWAVPLKVVIGLFLSALICLPSLYIFVCLSGSRRSLAQLGGLLLAALALGGILLAGFGPVTWVFSQSTNSIGFMGAMHLAFWYIALFFGLRLFETAIVFLDKQARPTLKLWSVIFILVVMQMCTALRPLIGPYQPLRTHEKKFFLAHWGSFNREVPREYR